LRAFGRRFYPNRLTKSTFVERDDISSFCSYHNISLSLVNVHLFSTAGNRVRFLLGGRHGDFKFLPPPGYAPCYEAVLPRDRLRIEPIKEYKHDFDGVRNLLGPTQSLSHTAFTPCPLDTVQVRLPPHPQTLTGPGEVAAPPTPDSNWAR